MPPSTDRYLACRWLNQQIARRNQQKPLLERPVFLVTGFSDENANCWTGAGSITRYGEQIYRNWHEMVHVIRFPTDEVLGGKFGPLAGRRMESFVDFGDVLREMMLELAPVASVTDDGYDLICHSMGGLDSYVALLEIRGNPPRTPSAPPEPQLGRAHHYITLDTPFRGVPNMDFRRHMAKTAIHRVQAEALFHTSDKLVQVLSRVRDLPARVRFLTCFNAVGASQVEVPATSAYLYGSAGEWAVERAATGYEEIAIVASHSGHMGITFDPVTISEIFQRKLGV